MNPTWYQTQTLLLMIVKNAMELVAFGHTARTTQKIAASATERGKRRMTMLSEIYENTIKDLRGSQCWKLNFAKDKFKEIIECNFPGGAEVVFDIANDALEKLDE